MEEMDILGFDPTSLSVFNEDATKNSGNPNIYKTKPSESKSDDGVYRSTIKIIYNPHHLQNSIIEQTTFSMQDEEGYFSAVSALSNKDTNCPIFKAWKKCHYAKEGSALWLQQAYKKDGGMQLFDKRFARYVTIQVLEDKNQPDLVGKYMFWKLPKSILDIINAKSNPAKESGKCPIPVMDFLFGKAFELEVHPGPKDPNAPERLTREIKYTGEFTNKVVSCINPDGSSMLNADEAKVLKNYVNAIQDVWEERDVEKRNELTAEINADPNTIELRKIYRKVLEQIKSVCPNVEEEFSYHGWTDELTERVQRWIDKVLDGKNPAEGEKTAGISSAVINDINGAAPSENATNVNQEVKAEDDDLPF